MAYIPLAPHPCQPHRIIQEGRDGKIMAIITPSWQSCFKTSPLRIPTMSFRAAFCHSERSEEPLPPSHSVRGPGGCPRLIPRASPALVSVLWVPLARASLRKRRGRTHPLSSPLDSGLRRNDDAPHPGSFKQPRRARSLLAERFRSRRLVRAGRPG